MFEPGSYDAVPHDNIRKVIARRLLEAKLTIPHFYLTLECNIGKLVAAREEINTAAPKDKDGKPAYKISVNDFVIKALALALQRVPDANVTWTEGAMLRHKHSDVGVAVSIPGGLITPVVRQAEQKSLSVISNEMKDFAARARARKLAPHEYQGGTSAVSNLGMYGIKEFYCHHQSAARHHSFGRRRRGARHRAERQDRSGAYDDRWTRDRSPRCRRGARRRSSGCVQGVDRKSGDDGGVS